MNNQRLINKLNKTFGLPISKPNVEKIYLDNQRKNIEITRKLNKLYLDKFIFMV